MMWMCRGCAAGSRQSRTMRTGLLPTGTSFAPSDCAVAVWLLLYFYFLGIYFYKLDRCNGAVEKFETNYLFNQIYTSLWYIRTSGGIVSFKHLTVIMKLLFSFRSTPTAGTGPDSALGFLLYPSRNIYIQYTVYTVYIYLILVRKECGSSLKSRGSPLGPHGTCMNFKKRFTIQFCKNSIERNEVLQSFLQFDIKVSKVKFDLAWYS